MKRKLISSLLVVGLSSLLLTGCMTDAEKDLKVADGRSNPWLDFDGREGGDYIIINSSGGVVLDVWKLRDSVVSSIENGDGWEFVDSKGNLNRVGGDVLVIRCNDKGTFDKYKEYHWDNTDDEDEEESADTEEDEY